MHLYRVSSEHNKPKWLKSYSEASKERKAIMLNGGSFTGTIVDRMNFKRFITRAELALVILNGMENGLLATFVESTERLLPRGADGKIRKLDGSVQP